MDIQPAEVDGAVKRFAGELYQLMHREHTAGRIGPSNKNVTHQVLDELVSALHDDVSAWLAGVAERERTNQTEAGEPSGSPADRAERFGRGLSNAGQRMADKLAGRELAGEDDDQGPAPWRDYAQPEAVVDQLLQRERGFAHLTDDQWESLRRRLYVFAQEMIPLILRAAAYAAAADHPNPAGGGTSPEGQS